MKKLFLLVILILSLTLALAACGGDIDGDRPPTRAIPQLPIPTAAKLPRAVKMAVSYPSPMHTPTPP